MSRVLRNMINTMICMWLTREALAAEGLIEIEVTAMWMYWICALVFTLVNYDFTERRNK